MATVTGIRRDLTVQSGWSSSDAETGAIGNITAAASHTLGTQITAAGHGLSRGETVRISGTAAGNDGRYDGYHVVLAVPSSSTFVIGQAFISTQASGTTRERTTRGDTLATTENMTVGNGTIRSQVVMDEPKTVLLGHQILAYDNSDGSPAVIFGADDNPVSVIDDQANSNWGTGGSWRGAATGENPVFRFRRVNYQKVSLTRPSAFGGNGQEIIVDARDCNFNWDYPTAVPFMGTGGLFVDCLFHGTVADASIDHTLFMALPRVFTGCTIRRWGIGLKQEQASAFFGQISLQDCDVEAFTSRAGTSAGRTDASINFVDSVFDRAKVVMSKGAAIRAFRTVRAVAALADGTAVAGATLYTMDGSTERKFALTMNCDVSAGVYRLQDTTKGSLTNVRDMAFLFRPGERITVSGFADAANNGAKTVRGELFAGARYAGVRNITVAESLTTALTDVSATFTKAPPVSDANGAFTPHLVHVFYAQAKDFGGQGYSAANTESVQEVLDDLTDIQAGTSTRVESDAFHRESWRLVMIPPYPYRLETLDVSLPMNTGGAPVPFEPALVNTPGVVETTAATVAAYTSFASLQQLYDYLIWRKRQSANHSFPRHDRDIVSITGGFVDFGALNVTFDVAASSLVSVSGTTVTIKGGPGIAATTALRGVRTTGTITQAANSAVPFLLTDTSGSTAVVSLSCADSAASLALFAPDGTQRGTTQTGSGDIALTGAQAVAGMKVVAARIGYRSQARTLDASAGGAIAATFGALDRLNRPDGTSMIAGAALSATIAVTFDNSDLTSPQQRIEIGNALAQVQPLMLESETSLVTADGLKYLAFGGGQVTLSLSPTAGNELFLPAGSRLKRAASGDSNAGVIATVYHAGGTPIDNANGDVQLASGLNISNLGSLLLVDLDIDPGAMGTQSVASLLISAAATSLAARDAINNGTHGLAAIRTAISGISGGGSAPSVADIVAGIQGADFPTVSGQDDRLGSLLQAIKAGGGAPTVPQIVAGIKGANFPPVSGESNRIGSLLHAIHTGNIAAVDVVQAIQGANFTTVAGEANRLGSLLQAIRSAAPPTAQDLVDAIRGANFPSVSGEGDRLGSLLQQIQTQTAQAPSNADITAIRAAVDNDDYGLEAIRDALGTGGGGQQPGGGGTPIAGLTTELTVAAFRQRFGTRFPEAQYPDDAVTRALQATSLLSSRGPDAKLYLAAHILILENEPAAIDGGAGVVSSEKIGPRTLQYLTTASASGSREDVWAWLALTPFGRQYREIEKRSTGRGLPIAFG